MTRIVAQKHATRGERHGPCQQTAQRSLVLERSLLSFSAVTAILAPIAALEGGGLRQWWGSLWSPSRRTWYCENKAAGVAPLLAVWRWSAPALETLAAFPARPSDPTFITLKGSAPSCPEGPIGCHQPLAAHATMHAGIRRGRSRVDFRAAHVSLRT